MYVVHKEYLDVMSQWMRFTQQKVLIEHCQYNLKKTHMVHSNIILYLNLHVEELYVVLVAHPTVPGV